MSYPIRRIFAGVVLCLTLIIVPSCFRGGNIQEVQTLALIEKEVANLDGDCLVVFDLDWTLLIGEDWINRSADSATRKKYLEKITKDLNREEWEDLKSRAIVQQKLIPVSEESPKLIRRLQAKGVKVIALTAASTGKFGVIEKIEDRRFEELKNVDIDFSSAFPSAGEIEFRGLKKDPRGCYPRFKRGILFGFRKGEALGAFLKRIGFIPRRLIFVDDRIKYVNEVAQMAKEMNIEFLGLHYTAAKPLLCKPDEDVVNLQFETFMKTGKWLSDEQAKKQLEGEEEE